MYACEYVFNIKTSRGGDGLIVWSKPDLHQMHKQKQAKTSSISKKE